MSKVEIACVKHAAPSSTPKRCVEMAAVVVDILLQAGLHTPSA